MYFVYGRTKYITVNPVTYCYINLDRSESGHGKYQGTLMEELKNAKECTHVQYQAASLMVSDKHMKYLY